MKEKLRKRWERFWMGFAGLSRSGRLATRLASIWTPPHTGRYYLARITTSPYLDPRATIHHAELSIAPHVFVAEHATIYQAKGGAAVSLGENAHVLRDCILETGQGGSLRVGADTVLTSAVSSNGVQRRYCDWRSRSDRTQLRAVFVQSYDGERRDHKTSTIDHQRRN